MEHVWNTLYCTPVADMATVKVAKVKVETVRRWRLRCGDGEGVATVKVATVKVLIDYWNLLIDY